MNTNKLKPYIKFDDDKKNIFYIAQNKKYRYADPEEQIRSKAYLELINYGYEPKRIDFEVGIPHRTPNILADIVVYNDDDLKDPHIVVECKKPEVSEGEFKQAVEQGFGNANSLKANYLWITSGIKNEYFNVKDFPSMERDANRLSDIPRFGQKKIDKAQFYKGGINDKSEQRKDLTTLNENELTRIFKQAHDALWAGGKRNPSEAFDEFDKLIFCKIWDEKKLRKNGEPYDFQVFSGEKNELLLKRIQTIYDKGKERDPEVFKDNIRLNPYELETVVSYLAGINLSDTDLDSKGRAFETFMGSFFRGDFGAFFTPRPIVKFIIESLPVTNEDIVLDPSCGSGGFLLYALDKVRRAADKMSDDGYFKKDSSKHYNFWHNFAESNLFGIEISESIARTAKMNMIIHDDGHTNVVSHDGLDSIYWMREKTKNKGFAKNKFDYIITNPPFGSSIQSSAKAYVKEYDLGKKNYEWIELKLKNKNPNKDEVRERQSSEVLFIEQCYNFLKPGGILAMVIPDGILTNSSLQYVRGWIEEHYRIIAVVSMPQSAFQATGAGVKSSVIFLEKYEESETAAIQKIKIELQDKLFENKKYGPSIEKIEREKKDTLKNNFAKIKEINESLDNHLKALENQGNIDKSKKCGLEKNAKDKIKQIEKSEEYADWRCRITDEFNERINAIKENLQEEFIESVKKKITDYPVFMAIAEDIGYDAAGRPTNKNELEDIAKELLAFIESVKKGTDSFFA
ncbi:MAG TPA: N-6 DNA methylase [bacterium]|nr:N-6 DNA methylase [bacterium]